MEKNAVQIYGMRNPIERHNIGFCLGQICIELYRDIAKKGGIDTPQKYISKCQADAF